MVSFWPLGKVEKMGVMLEVNDAHLLALVYVRFVCAVVLAGLKGEGAFFRAKM